jgi:hypothetical protein
MASLSYEVTRKEQRYRAAAQKQRCFSGNFALGLTGVKARQCRGDSSWSRDSLRVRRRENDGFVNRDR